MLNGTPVYKSKGAQLASFGFASNYEAISALNASGERWKPNSLKIRQMELNWQFPLRGGLNDI